MTDLITLDAVHRRYRLKVETIRAVNGISLSLRSGVVTGLVGPSGSGKTTLINLVIGWEQPDGGTVARDPDMVDDWRSIAVVPQALGLLAELSLAENIGLPARLGNPEDRTPAALLLALGLDELGDRMPHEASLGEQQRTAVARALATDPRVLVADEPTSHQDEANVAIVANMLRQAADDGAAVLVATHDDRLLEIADEVHHIENGSIIEPPASPA
jgi:ABC-type lipoprotein export system ATPase subunit